MEIQKAWLLNCATMTLPAMLVICRARGNTFSSHIICRINLASVHVNSSRRSRWGELLKCKHRPIFQHTNVLGKKMQWWWKMFQQTCKDFWCFLEEPWLSPPSGCVRSVQSGGNFYSVLAPWLRSPHHTPGGHRWRSSLRRRCDPERHNNIKRNKK